MPMHRTHSWLCAQRALLAVPRGPHEVEDQTRVGYMQDNYLIPVLSLDKVLILKAVLSLSYSCFVLRAVFQGSEEDKPNPWCSEITRGSMHEITPRVPQGTICTQGSNLDWQHVK